MKADGIESLTRRQAQPASIISYGQGRKLLVEELREDSRYPEIWSLAKQDVHNASIFWWLFAGVGLAGFFPPLIFLAFRAKQAPPASGS